MEKIFEALLQSFQIPNQTITEIWQNLVKHYQEPHRHYHNLSHIQALLEQFDRVKTDLHQPEIVLLAIFYHDVIYQTTGKQAISNERQSADYFVDEMGKLLPKEKVDRVVALILATEKHELMDENDSDMAYFLDMDLSILGRDQPIYQRYCQQIRLEYQHVAKILYNFGRKKALKRFLHRERLYFTERFFAQYEVQARHNITREIAILTVF